VINVDVILQSSCAAATVCPFSANKISRKEPTIMLFSRLILDFGTIPALTLAESPGVVQVRAQNMLPSHPAVTVIAVCSQIRNL
jgi:hypothetical protein